MIILGAVFVQVCVIIAGAATVLKSRHNESGMVDYNVRYTNINSELRINPCVIE